MAPASSYKLVTYWMAGSLRDSKIAKNRSEPSPRVADGSHGLSQASFAMGSLELVVVAAAGSGSLFFLASLAPPLGAMMPWLVLLCACSGW